MNMENALATQTVENPSSSIHAAAARYAGCPNKTTKHVVRPSQLVQGIATPASIEEGGLNVVA